MADYRENVIEFYADEKTATVTFTQGRYITRIRKLAESNPTECEIVAENKDGSIVAHIPVRWVKIYPGGTGREFSEEEKAANSERLKKMWEERKQENITK